MNLAKLIPSKGRNFVEDCQPTKNLLGSLAHPFGGSLAHLFFFGSLAHPFKWITSPSFSFISFFVTIFKEILRLFI